MAINPRVKGLRLGSLWAPYGKGNAVPVIERMSLSVVGTFDTGIFDRNIFDNVLGPIVVATLSATESSDVASVNVSNFHTAALAATETADTVAVNVSNYHTAALAATETADTISFDVSVTGGTITASLAATETADTVAFVVDSGAVAASQPLRYGGGGAPIWPGALEALFKKKKPKKEEIVAEVAEVVAEAVPQVTADESHIVAARLVAQMTIVQLQQIQSLDALIERVEAELAELDDEEVLLLAA